MPTAVSQTKTHVGARPRDQQFGATSTLTTPITRIHDGERVVGDRRRSIFEWLARYNTHRRHTSLGCLTPDQYELDYRHTSETTPALST